MWQDWPDFWISSVWVSLKVLETSDQFLLSGNDHVLDKHTDGHWAHTSWHWGDVRCDLPDIFKVHIAHKSLAPGMAGVGNRIDTAVDHNRSWLHPILIACVKWKTCTQLETVHTHTHLWQCQQQKLQIGELWQNNFCQQQPIQCNRQDGWMLIA